MESLGGSVGCSGAAACVERDASERACRRLAEDVVARSSTTATLLHAAHVDTLRSFRTCAAARGEVDRSQPVPRPRCV